MFTPYLCCATEGEVYFQYKFTLGSWGTVEETSSCGYVANRTFDFNTADATYTASDTVAAWDGLGSC
jgi:alpha-amylase